ncbi:exonuclease 3'-5' domain-containing protein 2-like isoform X2 [Adelges cooleyi]|uniref:exonuclease 3'-5' domain-containing protein 2-like isoform X2 n=2 Tax=Adelges cooleyi TaxID=133065 RepID=UPI00217F3F47|nr:exonuclease 3'-5' domain-containing protein 2-like isoform X2 [Adelges cooleyi]
MAMMMIKLCSKIPLLSSFLRLRPRRICVVNSLEECEEVAIKFEKSCANLPVIGLDCEWVTENEVRRPIALLQIADNDGTCSLIRLSKFKTIPQRLSNLLSDDQVIKVGVAISDDAQFLMSDYNIEVSGFIDLRYLAKKSGLAERSLAALSYKLLGCELDKDWRVRASNWEEEVLTDRQINYAALDAYVAVKIFEQFRNKMISWQNWFMLSSKQKWDFFTINCIEFKDLQFKNSNGSNGFKHKTKPNIRLYSTSTIKTTTVYDNCLMENVDGIVMSTCSHKKVDWYISQGLAKLVNDNPRTIRLNFPAEIKNRKDAFSIHFRDNICTVCGRTEHFRKKSIIPKEFVRHMPVEYKSHIPHDTLLLCYWCHIRANTSDIEVRKRLFEICNVTEFKTNEHHKIPAYIKIIRSKHLAKTLLKTGNKVPQHVAVKLKQEIADIYNIELVRLSDTFLEHLLNIKSLKYGSTSQQYNAAEKVVEWFVQRGTLNEMKTIWRQHFIDTMKPKYLPALWSVTYEG